MQNNPIARSLSSILLGPEITFENLTMVPLVALPTVGAGRGTRQHPATSVSTPHPSAPLSTPQHPSAPFNAPDYVVLDDALRRGSAEITEVSEHGSVPELRFVNRGRRAVLIVDGEELVGAKQNRVVNLSILVAAASELTIPVSCVEAGRWRARSRKFAAAPRAQYATGRAKRMKHVTDSLHFDGSRRSDQAEVWADIARKSERLKSSSPTAAMEAMFVDYASSIESFVRACAPIDGQVGALFAVNDVVIGFDLFDRESTLRKVLPKLVRSVAIDALDARPVEDAPDLLGAKSPRKDRVPSSSVRAASVRFIASVSAAGQQAAKGVGLGDDVRLNAPGLVGAGLIVDGAAIHVSAFNESAAA